MSPSMTTLLHGHSLKNHHHHEHKRRKNRALQIFGPSSSSTTAAASTASNVVTLVEVEPIHQQCHALIDSKAPLLNAKAKPSRSVELELDRINQCQPQLPDLDTQPIHETISLVMEKPLPSIPIAPLIKRKLAMEYASRERPSMPIPTPGQPPHKLNSFSSRPKDDIEEKQLTFRYPPLIILALFALLLLALFTIQVILVPLFTATADQLQSGLMFRMMGWATWVSSNRWGRLAIGGYAVFFTVQYVMWKFMACIFAGIHRAWARFQAIHIGH